MEFLVANKWSGNGLMMRYNQCDDVCTRGSECGCTCDIDVWELSDKEVSSVEPCSLRIRESYSIVVSSLRHSSMCVNVGYK